MSLDISHQNTLRQLHREQRDELRRLVGDQADSLSPLHQLTSQYRYALPEAKLTPALRIIEDYDELRSELFVFNLGSISIASESGAQLQAIEQAQRQELAAILSPEELERYTFSTSQTAFALRFKLTSFVPTEEEFRLIFQKQQALDQQLGSSQTPEDLSRRATAERALTEEIKAALGPERGAEYERGTDHNYRLTSQLAQRLQLPSTTAPEAWKLQMDIMARAAKLRSDSQLPPAERTAQSAALLQEATTQLTTLFGGQQGFELYKQYGGYWLGMLQSSPVRRSPRRKRIRAPRPRGALR